MNNGLESLLLFYIDKGGSAKMSFLQIKCRFLNCTYLRFQYILYGNQFTNTFIMTIGIHLLFLAIPLMPYLIGEKGKRIETTF